MSRVIVGSVFCNHPRLDDWYKLQLNFLNQTTNFTHVVFSDANYNFNHSYVLPQKTKINESNHSLKGSQAHVFGLNAILDFFRTTNEQYFLILDSDCFPIRKNWLEDLLESHENYDIFAPARYENLETHAHPSAFLFKKSALNNLKFDIMRMNSIHGKVYYDTASNCQTFFPMIRSNKKNLHPILYGLYFDTFYHHGAGSRNLCFRSFKMNYYKEQKYNYTSEYENFKFLINNPKKFISSLSYTKQEINFL